MAGSARQFDAAWRDWVGLNVARGCAREDLIRILLEAGFAREKIFFELDRAANRSAARRDPQHVPLAGETGGALTRLGWRRMAQNAELFVGDDVFSGAECARVIALMQDRLRPSTITVPEAADPYFRRSQTCDLHPQLDPIVQEIDARLGSLLKIDPAFSEPLQAQHYGVGDEFKAHTDYFEPYELERNSSAQLGQRSWTAMVYLSAPGAGGETAFPRLGLVLSPHTGRVVAWNNLDPAGNPNYDTLHQALPVRAGSKSILTKWFRLPRGARS